MQPDSELGILQGGKKAPAGLFVVEPLDTRILAVLADDRLDDQVVLGDAFNGRAGVVQRLELGHDRVRESSESLGQPRFSAAAPAT